MNKKTPRDYLNDCRRLLNMGDRADTYYDLHLSASEKGVLLRAANLSDSPQHKARKLREWTPADQKRIKEAAKRASEWAAGLGVA